MRSLVVGDIHQDLDPIRWLLDNEHFDELISVGDWVDTKKPQSEVLTFEETCYALRALILRHEHKRKIRFILGNHDLQYIYASNALSTSHSCKENPYSSTSYSHKKAKKWRKCFFDANLKDSFFLEHFALAYQTQGWTISHAGIIPEHIPKDMKLKEFVESECEQVWKNFRNLDYPNNYILRGVGRSRGGKDNFGGMLWLDWDKEFYMHPETGNQILGHTRVAVPESKHLRFGDTLLKAWNINTEKHYGVIEDGIFGFREFYEDRTLGVKPGNDLVVA